MSTARSVLDEQDYTKDERDFLLPVCEMSQERSRTLVERVKGAAAFGADHF